MSLQSCPTVRPQRWQPTRLPRLWDFPGKNTGLGCHFLPQCMKVKSESEVAQSYPTLSDPMDCSLSGSSVQWIFQARVLEWGAIAFSDIIILSNHKKKKEYRISIAIDSYLQDIPLLREKKASKLQSSVYNRLLFVFRG